MSHDRDWGFFLWTAGGFCAVLGFITAIGLPFALLAVILLVQLSRRGPVWPDQLGLVAGAGLVCLLIAFISAVSDGVSPAVWLASGLVLTATPAGAFWWLRCRPATR